MIRQVKDRFYEEVVNEPSREKFREFIKNNVGELDEVDFKEQWISKGELSKLLLAMANSRGGVIVIGIKENDDGTLEPIGLEELKDKADINNEVAKYISPALDYEVFDFVYNAAEYAALNGKKFQMVHVHDTPDRLPFFSLNETNGLGKNEVYIRRGTKCEKATAEEIERIIDTKISTIFKESSNLSLGEHLNQLRQLYDELPETIRVLVKKGRRPEFATGLLATIKTMANSMSLLYGEPDEYEERPNPNFPEETYEAFIVRMIKQKKLKIEKVLDLK